VAAVRPARGGDGDDDALGSTVGDGAGVGNGALVAGAVVECVVADGMTGVLQPASTKAATMPLTRRASIMKVERGFQVPVSPGAAEPTHG
jgi:hypothetical protein